VRRLKRAPADIRAVACVRGPGSFTGLRLALATAAGLGRAVGALQAGIDHLPLLAANALSLLGESVPTLSHVWTVTHARRQLAHAQGFALSPAPSPADEAAPSAGPAGPSFSPRTLSPVTEILVASPRELAAVISAHAVPGRTFAVAGSGLGRNRAVFASAFAADPSLSPLLLPPAHDAPSAESLLRAAALARYAAEDITPLYARPSDAEENLEHIASSLGLDPAKARERLNALLRKGL
jgi:tRNA threonylcarbamoyl adenosine modification protein YeaZ